MNELNWMYHGASFIHLLDFPDLCACTTADKQVSKMFAGSAPPSKAGYYASIKRLHWDGKRKSAAKHK